MELEDVATRSQQSSRVNCGTNGAVTFIKDRQRDGIQRAKTNGLYKGGQRRIDRDAVLTLKQGGMTPTQIAAEMGCSRMQVYRILNRT